jgi:hypothetical protein
VFIDSDVSGTNAAPIPGSTEFYQSAQYANHVSIQYEKGCRITPFQKPNRDE